MRLVESCRAIQADSFIAGHQQGAAIQLIGTIRGRSLCDGQVAAFKFEGASFLEKRAAPQLRNQRVALDGQGTVRQKVRAGR